ncbi:MAG: DUF3078 domain-containing protein [Bacteroidetes bacterium]|nr:MAG: DUF3078 domain-containing protein [Bacteroidota bacterium]
MKYFIFTILILFNYCVYAQTETTTAPTDTTVKSNWTPVGTVGLNASQIAFSDWSQGGDNSVAWSFLGNFGFKYESNPWLLSNSLKLAYGMTKLGQTDFRSTDNEIYLETVLSHKIGWVVDPYISNTIRTVITDGYDYKVTPEVQTAAFFDPGYVTQSLGFTFNKEKFLSTRLGVAFQEVFTNKMTQYTDDADTPNEIESFKFETGIESVSESEYSIEDNVLYQGKLRLFTRFKHLDTWDVRWDNIITAKVSKYFNVNLMVQVVYEKQQSLRTQVKEALQLGVTFSIF